jgi:hypothetical protein
MCISISCHTKHHMVSIFFFLHIRG